MREHGDAKSDVNVEKVEEVKEEEIEGIIGDVIEEKKSGNFEVVCVEDGEEENDDDYVITNEGAETVGTFMPMPLRGFSLFIILSLPFAIWSLGLGG